MRAFAIALLLASCASSQPRVCSLSSVEMKNGERDALVEAQCDGPLLEGCADAERIRAEWRKMWDDWEQCPR